MPRGMPQFNAGHASCTPKMHGMAHLVSLVLLAARRLRSGPRGARLCPSDGRPPSLPAREKACLTLNAHFFRAAASSQQASWLAVNAGGGSVAAPPRLSAKGKQEGSHEHGPAEPTEGGEEPPGNGRGGQR